jgi:hypothetical protein
MASNNKKDWLAAAIGVAISAKQRSEADLSTVKQRRRIQMRSDLIFGALAHVSNRYQLCQLASKATRKLHRPNTRLQDTANEVFVRFHHENPVAPASSASGVSQVQQRRAA